MQANILKKYMTLCKKGPVGPFQMHWFRPYGQIVRSSWEGQNHELLTVEILCQFSDMKATPFPWPGILQCLILARTRTC